MKKNEFIERVRTERERWNNLVNAIPDAAMLAPPVEDDWSAKDVVAHVVWYEREMVRMLEARDFLVGSDLWHLPLDERNAAVHEEIRDKSIATVRAESKTIFAALLEQLESLPEDAYADPAHFRNMPSEWAPWYVIAGNTFRHYIEHTESLRELAEDGGD